VATAEAALVRKEPMTERMATELARLRACLESDWNNTSAPAVPPTQQSVPVWIKRSTGKVCEGRYDRAWNRFNSDMGIAVLDVVGWMPRYEQPAPGGRDNG
jgi:hypothetical protein